MDLPAYNISARTAQNTIHLLLSQLRSCRVCFGLPLLWHPVAAVGTFLLVEPLYISYPAVVALQRGYVQQ
jgi:hypothetical protein